MANDNKDIKIESKDYINPFYKENEGQKERNNQLQDPIKVAVIDLM